MMTKEEIFSVIKNHLLTQNARAMGPIPGAPGEMTCVYRTSDGRKCVAGVLIKDEFYKPSMEGMAASSFEVKAALILSGVPEDCMALVDNLQLVHDETPVEEWPETFRKIGDHLGINE